MYRPIHWALASTGGRQKELDGSRLLNLYAVQAIHPSESKVPVALHGTPGHKPYLRIPPQDYDRSGMTISPPAGIHALIGIDNPNSGRRIVGVSAGAQLFDVRFGSGLDVDADYYPNRLPEFQQPAFESTAAERALDDLYEEDTIFQISDVADDQATGPARVASNGDDILVVSNRNVKRYDLSARSILDVLAPTPTDMNAELPDQDWVDVVFLDGYFVLAARNGQFFHSELDSTHFDQLDFATAESAADGLVGCSAFHRNLYLFGNETVEQWYNAAGGSGFSFRPDLSQLAHHGCYAQATIVPIDYGIFYLASTGEVRGVAASAQRRISTETVEQDISSAIPEKSRAYYYVEEGHRFYVLTLEDYSGNKKTWAYDLMTKLWHERSDTEILCALRWGNRNLIGRVGDNNVHEQHLSFPTANGTAITRKAISPVLFADQHHAYMDNFQLHVANNPGEDDDTIKLSISDDGQRTWKTQDAWAKDLNEPRLKWNQLGTFDNIRNIQIETSAQRQIDIFGAYVGSDAGEH